MMRWNGQWKSNEANSYLYLFPAKGQWNELHSLLFWCVGSAQLYLSVAVMVHPRARDQSQHISCSVRRDDGYGLIHLLPLTVDSTTESKQSRY
mmetsp:Transcript_2770/g.8148  ORF Transcript_2770/g.8148 Transcript_2770/m.8148 type:complete len:93 (-) Transcript_2770:36-314(-)